MKTKTLIFLCLALLLASCATMDPDYEQPYVNLTSIRAIPSEGGGAPAFEVGLRITNPNASELNIQGIVYAIELEGHEIVKGVGRDYPVIEGYSHEDVTLVASVQLLSGLRLFADLLSGESDSLTYEFRAKLDPGGFYPAIRVSESGRLDLGGSPR